LAVDKLHPPHHLCLATATDSNAIAVFQIQLGKLQKIRGNLLGPLRGKRLFTTPKIKNIGS
jgi:hypothetical protein